MKTLFQKIEVKHFILLALLLALTVQVFNTANLYARGTHLVELEKLIACYFIGFSAEFAIFICICAGSRAAGASFALLTFMVGILFHDTWDKFLIDLPYFNHDISLISEHKNFFSTTLLQFINSVLVWFLSELYVKKLAEKSAIKQISAESAGYLAKISQQEQIITEQHAQNVSLQLALSEYQAAKTSFICEECRKPFATQQALNAHKRIHNEETVTA